MNPLAKLTVREKFAEVSLIVAVVQISVAPEQRGWRPLRHGGTLLVGGLVQKLVHIVLVTWMKPQSKKWSSI